MGTDVPGTQVSIIITCYNAREVIGPCLKSLQEQTFRNFEVIIVDDGSNDGTPAEVEKMLATMTLPNATVVRSERVGRARALNRGIAVSLSPLVTILDADDVLHPEYLDAVVSFMAENDHICVASAKPVTWSDVIPEWRTLSRNNLWEQLQPFVFALRNPLCHSGTTIRKAALLDVGRYDETRTMQLDYDLWVRLIRRGYMIAQSGEAMVGKRIHGHQFFEGRRRIRYSWSAFVLQRQAIRALDLPMWLIVLPYLKLLYNITLGSLRRRAIRAIR